MPNRITRISIAFVGVGLLLIQIQGPWLFFKLQQQNVRAEIKQRLKAGVPEKDLVTLKIAKIWESEVNTRFTRIHAKEFRFDGEMYDIMRTEDQGDTTAYVCIHDVKEGGLFAQLDGMVEAENQSPAHQNKRKKMEDLLSLKFVPSQNASLFREFTGVLEPPFVDERVQIDFPDRDGPPPEHQA